MGSVLPHFPQSGAVAQRRWQDDRHVPTQSCSDKWKFGQGGEKEIHAPTSVHIAPLEKGKDTGCEGGAAAAEGEGGGCYRVTRESGGGGLVSQGCQTTPPSSRESSCKLHEEDEVCPIGTP